MKNHEESNKWGASNGRFLIERHIADTMTTAHWHDHIEINLLLSGQMTYLFNGKQEKVASGRLVLFWAAIPHQTIAVSADAPLVCIYIPLADFLAMTTDKDERQAILQGQFVTQHIEEPTDAILMSRWEQEWRSGTPARRILVEDETKLRVRRLILDNAEMTNPAIDASPRPFAAPSVRHVELLTDLINRHYADAVSVPELARLAGMHASTANKAFRDVLGISVNEYVLRYRLARAMQRLTDTNDSVLQIAFDCGFGSSSRFYDIFRDRTGVTPRRFRESIKG